MNRTSSERTGLETEANPDEVKTKLKTTSFDDLAIGVHDSAPDSSASSPLIFSTSRLHSPFPLHSTIFPLQHLTMSLSSILKGTQTPHQPFVVICDTPTLSGQPVIAELVKRAVAQ